MRKYRVPDIRVPIAHVAGGKGLLELLAFRIGDINEEDSLLISLQIPVDEDGSLDPGVFARFFDHLDLKQGP